MRSVGYVGLAVVLLMPAVDARAQPAALDARGQAVFGVLDRNGDGVISCLELAGYLEPLVMTKVRELGGEPRQIGSVAPCGSRTDADTTLEPDQSFPEYLRRLVQSALNRVESATGDSDITPRGLFQLYRVALAAPLSGTTVGDLLPDVAQGTAPAATTANWIARLSKRIKLRQSFLDEKSIGKPAKLSFTSYGADDETLADEDARRVYAIKAAVIVESPKEWVPAEWLRVAPTGAFEMNVASNTPTKDQVVGRLGASSLLVRNSAASAFSVQMIDATADFSTDRGGDAFVVGTTVQYTMNYRRIGIGRYLGGGATVDFRWRPYVGLIWNHVYNAGNVAAYKDQTSFTHTYVRLTGEVRVTNRVKITPELTVWHGDRTPTGGAVTHWQTRATVDTRLVLLQSEGVDNASLVLSWTDGRDSPGFEREQSTVLAFAVKF